MKKYFLSIVFFSLLTLSSSAQSKLLAYLSYADFNTQENNHFLETYLTIIGNSIEYPKNTKGKFQGTVQVAIAFVQNDSIKNFKKYNLLSSEYDSANAGKLNFIDQQRFFLSPGEYLMEIDISDKNDTLPGFHYSEKITLNFPLDKAAFSEIELIESYKPTQQPNILSKSGYDLVPYVSKYYPGNMNRLNFYTELYNINKIMPEKEKFLLSYFIEDYDTKQKLNDFSSFVKQEAAPVSSLLNGFALDKLPTGNYMLCLEARDRENKVLAERKLFFQRFNPAKGDTIPELSKIQIENTFLRNYHDMDSLIDMLLCIRPISTPAEATYGTNQLKYEDEEMMKRFFYAFWQKRNPLHPEEEWLKYKVDVDEANRLFGTSIRNKKGFNTDRGRVYLQYGMPDVRSVNDHEPTSYPYEIWQYNRLSNGQTNRRFVFYNPFLGTNDYRLIHADARGEVSDTRWRYIIDNRSSVPAAQKYNLDNENIYRNDFGRQVDDLYRNPR